MLYYFDQFLVPSRVMAITYDMGTYINVCVYMFLYVLYNYMVAPMPRHITCLNGSIQGICNKSFLRDYVTFQSLEIA